MKKNTTLASLLLSIVFLTACSGGYSSHCDGKAGELHKALATKDSGKSLAIIASSSNLDADATCQKHLHPALAEAARLGYTAVVMKLLEKGAAIDKQNNNGRTALILAARNGHLSVVQHLLQRGAAIDKQDTFGYTALIWAANTGHLSVVQHLLQRGADIDKQDNYGYTALMGAIKSYGVQGNIPLFKALINTPQNFHLTNKKGQTALEMAEEKFKQAAPADKKFYSLVIAMLKQKMRP